MSQNRVTDQNVKEKKKEAFSKTLKKDLQEIYRYISYDSKFYAKLQILKIKKNQNFYYFYNTYPEIINQYKHILIIHSLHIII